jgi:putative hydrolase of the HAD superfamily
LGITVFDMDDTLFAERDYALSGLAAIGGHLASRYGHADATQQLIEAFEQGDRHLVFNAVLPQLGLPLSLIPELVARYREHIPVLQFYPDALACIERCRTWGDLALITDGPAICQRRKVEALGLRDLLDLVIITDDGGREAWKPSESAYRKVMSHFGVQGQDCCYIGDNSKKDFLAPNRLGWTTICVSREGRFYTHDPPTTEHAAAHQLVDLTSVAVGEWPLAGAA